MVQRKRGLFLFGVNVTFKKSRFPKRDTLSRGGGDNLIAIYLKKIFFSANLYRYIPVTNLKCLKTDFPPSNFMKIIALVPKRKQFVWALQSVGKEDT